jgi:hypothetical protein
MITKRNLLCAKAKEKLELGQILLYEPYKNILINFKELCININAKDFDPVAKVYDGLLSVPSEIREYYEALLGVTSYYQHSQGGRGRYIEKKIASTFLSCSLDIKLSELPIWLEFPEVHKKRGIFTLAGLTNDEKRVFRVTQWDWIGNKDESTDLGSILSDEKTVVLAEIKNRVDSGGSAARREIWTSQKFGIIVEYLLNNDKVFRKGAREFSLAELFKFFNFEKLELYIGILFDIRDSPASIENDKANGFYSTSKEGFTYLKNKIDFEGTAKILDADLENLQVEILLTTYNLKLKLGALYGNDVTSRLFRKDSPVSDLLLLKYDDMWLSQLITIDERAMLLKYQKNYMSTLLDLLKRDRDLRIKYDAIINSECGETELSAIVNYLLNKYTAIFEDKILPPGKEKANYLADVIQVLCMAEA